MLFVEQKRNENNLPNRLSEQNLISVCFFSPFIIIFHYSQMGGRTIARNSPFQRYQHLRKEWEKYIYYNNELLAFVCFSLNGCADLVFKSKSKIKKEKTDEETVLLYVFFFFSYSKFEAIRLTLLHFIHYYFIFFLFGYGLRANSMLRFWR